MAKNKLQLKFCDSFLLFVKGGSFCISQEREEKMNLFKEVLRKNLKMIVFYVIIGIIINFIDLYSVTYYQKILDAFQFKTLTIVPLIIYGISCF